MSDSELNGNVSESFIQVQTTSSSMEDLSEYTDADESISAPTEILAEFLSSIMMKDYEKALKYCKLILNYEPNNPTAKDFYPLIVEKLELNQNDEDYEDNSSESSDNCSLSSITSSEIISNNEDESKKSVDSDGTSASYSSLEDDEISAENIDTDYTNGNVNNIQNNISSSIGQENTFRELRSEKEEFQTKCLVPVSHKMHPTPTVTLKRGSSFVSRTQTYTKSFLSHSRNTPEVNNSQSPKRNAMPVNNHSSVKSS